MSPEKRRHTSRPDKKDPDQQSKELEALLSYDPHVVDALVSKDGKLAPGAKRNSLPQNLTREEIDAIRQLVHQAEDVFDTTAQATPQWQEFQRQYSGLQQAGRNRRVSVVNGKEATRLHRTVKEGRVEFRVPQRIFTLYVIRRDIDNDERLEGYMLRTSGGLSASWLRDRIIRLDNFVRDNLSTQI